MELTLDNVLARIKGDASVNNATLVVPANLTNIAITIARYVNETFVDVTLNVEIREPYLEKEPWLIELPYSETQKLNDK